MNLEEIDDFATLTGSSLVPGVIPRDLDYFALWDKEKIEEVRQKLCKLPYYKHAEDPSTQDWRDTLCFAFKLEDGRKVELFFANHKYYRVLRLYTQLVIELCRDMAMRVYLAHKPNRVRFCEALRTIADRAPGEELV